MNQKLPKQMEEQGLQEALWQIMQGQMDFVVFVHEMSVNAECTLEAFMSPIYLRSTRYKMNIY